MFGWCFLQFMDSSCALIPLLVPYLHGVAVTSVSTFICGFLHIVMSDDSEVYKQRFENVSKPNSAFDSQKILDDLFSNISVFLMILHLFWFLFGSINILPVIFIEGLYISSNVLRIHDCDAPVHFWFTFLCLLLQWFLLLVVTVWYQLHATMDSKDDGQKSLEKTEEKQQLIERQDSWQYYSFPNPSFWM